jgi:hypothetical protein
VKSYREKIKAGFEHKLALLEEIKQQIEQEKSLLANEQMHEFLNACNNVNKMLEQIKTVDYEIARLESFSDNDNYSADLQIKILIDKIVAISCENHNSIGELTAEAEKKKNGLKTELKDTVKLQSIGGYKPFTGTQSVYFDRRN